MRNGFLAALLALAATASADVWGPSRQVRLLSLSPEGSGFRAVWMEKNEQIHRTPAAVYSARLAIDGTLAQPPVNVGTFVAERLVDVRGPLPMIAWTTDAGVFVSPVDRAGVRHREGKRVGSRFVLQPEIACTTSRCAAVTAEGLTFFDPNGDITSGPFPYSGFSLSIDAAGAVFADRAPYEFGAVRITRVLFDGTVAFSRDLHAQILNDWPLIATDGTNYAVVWPTRDSSRFEGALLGPDGTVLSRRTLLTLPGPYGDVEGSNLMWNGASYILGIAAGKLDRIHGTPIDVQIVRLDPTLAPAAEPRVIDTARTGYPATPLLLAANGDRVAIVWHRFKGDNSGWDRSPRVSVAAPASVSTPYWLETPQPQPRRRAR